MHSRKLTNGYEKYKNDDFQKNNPLISMAILAIEFVKFPRAPGNAFGKSPTDRGFVRRPVEALANFGKHKVLCR